MTASASPGTPADRRQERRARNRALAALRDKGATWRAVGETFGLSERHARRAYLEHVRDAGRVIDVDPEEILGNVLAVHTDALEQLRTIAAAADSDSARVGAVRSRVTVSHDLLRLLERTGKLPPADFAARLRLEGQKQAFAAAIVEVLDGRGLDLFDLEADLDRVLAGAVS